MAGRAKHAFQSRGGSGGTYRKAKAGNAVRPEFFQRLVRIGLRVTALVGVVVGETVRQEEQQPVRGASLSLQNLACPTDAGAETRVAGGLKLLEAGSPDGAESLTEGFDRGQVDSVSPVGPERVDRDAISQLLECRSKGSGRPSLMVVHGEAVRIDVGGGSGSVEQDEDAEVSSQLSSFCVDVFRWRRAGAQVYV